MTVLSLDPFGVGAAQFMALDLFENASRASGRTQMILSSVKLGDAVIFPDLKSRRAHQHYFRGVKVVEHPGFHNADSVLMVVIDPTSDYRAAMSTNRTGHTYLTHEFVSEVYRQALRRAAYRLTSIEEDLSGAPAAKLGVSQPGARMRETTYGLHPL